MIFSKSVVGNSSIAKAQYQKVIDARVSANMQEKMFINSGQIVGNTGLIPRDVYQELDSVTVERMRSDDGDVVLNDLLPLSRSVNIGKIVYKSRRSSDAGNANFSISGQTGIKSDQVEYSYDGTIIPIVDASFGRDFREWNAHKSEGFDALIDDQREVVATVREKIVDGLMDGFKDASGNYIKVDGLDWKGIRNDSRVASIDLGVGGLNFDFTDNTKTGDEIKAKFIEVRNVMWITNNCGRDLTVYISREIASNWERRFSQNYEGKLITQELASLMGIAEIKVTNKLVGNQLMGLVLDQNFVRPLVGMGLNTVAMPRPVYNSRYEFVTWGAIGFEIRTDYSGNTCAFYAAG